MKFILSCLSILMLGSNAYAEVFETRPDKLPPRSLVEQLEGTYAAAPGITPRPLLRIGLTLIKEFEGWYPRPYNDGAGYCTIGFGHLIGKGRCAAIPLGEFNNGLSRQQGEALLLQDTTTARVGVQTLVSVQLNDEQFAALTSLVFNIGSGNFAKSSMRRLLNDNNIAVAGTQFRRYVLANGIALPGLVTRRGCETALYRAVLTLLRDGRLDRSECVSNAASPSAGPDLDIITGN